MLLFLCCYDFFILFHCTINVYSLWYFSFCCQLPSSSYHFRFSAAPDRLYLKIVLLLIFFFFLCVLSKKCWIQSLGWLLGVDVDVHRRGAINQDWEVVVCWRWFQPAITKRHSITMTYQYNGFRWWWSSLSLL